MTASGMQTSVRGSGRLVKAYVLMTSTAKTAFAPADAAFHIDNAIVSRETPLKHRATVSSD
jgi:hypothetical protein